MKRIIQFFKDSYAELRKVTWPSKDEAMASTKVVIVMVLLSAFFLGIVDIILFQGIDFLFRVIPV
ncbi:MAG: preprotein translocase subunit SecE [Spirochaetaceae bacterium]|nr:MAG: preprotein translocase subunit SecE [Spirochaetaceae bacterium]